MGKSRLIVELAQRLDSEPGLVARWRQASCPAYGEGLTLWPLTQIAKDHAGILEGDDAGEIDRKLQRVLAGEPDGTWIAGRLRPLLGLPSPQATREENFAAWLRFLEVLSGERPTVLVLEDIHWAGDLMLDFLDYVVRNIDDVPLLGIGTTRPDLLDAHPAYQTQRAEDASISRVVQLEVPPLSVDESQRLVGALIQPHGHVGCAGRHHQAQRGESAVRRGARPTVGGSRRRRWRERRRTGRHDPAGTVGIAADTYRSPAGQPQAAPEGLLSDAAVVGEVFWAGALAAVSGLDPQEVEGALAALESRKLVRRSQGSPDGGRGRAVLLAFAHARSRVRPAAARRARRPPQGRRRVARGSRVLRPSSRSTISRRPPSSSRGRHTRTSSPPVSWSRLSPLSREPGTVRCPSMCEAPDSSMPVLSPSSPPTPRSGGPCSWRGESPSPKKEISRALSARSRKAWPRFSTGGGRPRRRRP